MLGDETVAGWKILATAPVGAYSTAPLGMAGLVPDGGAFRVGDRGPEVEVEIAIRIEADLPPRAEPYAREEVLAALALPMPPSNSWNRGLRTANLHLRFKPLPMRRAAEALPSAPVNPTGAHSTFHRCPSLSGPMKRTS